MESIEKRAAVGLSVAVAVVLVLTALSCRAARGFIGVIAGEARMTDAGAHS